MDAVPEVEDVPGRPGGRDHVPSTLPDRLRGLEQRRRIEVALDRRTEGLAGLSHLDGPVEAHDVGAGLLKQLQPAAHRAREHDRRNVEIGEDPPVEGQQHLPVGRGRERPGVGVKQLEDIRAVVALVGEKLCDDVGDRCEQRLEGRRIPCPEPAQRHVTFRRFAGDRVGREREGSHGEADQRRLDPLVDPLEQPTDVGQLRLDRSAGFSITGPTSDST